MNNSTNNNQSPSRCVLLKKLQALDFAIIETALFLDTHPTDAKVLKYYKETLEERNNVMKQFEKLYGPLSIFNNASDSNWQWVKGPWPWELED